MAEVGTIIDTWGLDAGLHSKEEILAALAQRIQIMLDQDIMHFIQIMYRLDIAESQLEVALHGENSSHQIAQLIWSRQQQKNIHRKITPLTDVDQDLRL